MLTLIVKLVKWDFKQYNQ